MQLNCSLFHALRCTLYPLDAYLQMGLFVCRNMKTTLYSDSAGADICCGHSVFVLVSIYDISVAHVLCSRGHVV